MHLLDLFAASKSAVWSQLRKAHLGPRPLAPGAAKLGALWSAILICTVLPDHSAAEVFVQDSQIELSATGPRMSRTCLLTLKPQLTLGETQAPVLTLITSGLNHLTFGVRGADRYEDLILVQNNVRQKLDSASYASLEHFLASSTGKAIASHELFFITGRMADTVEYVSSRYEPVDLNFVLAKIETYCPFDAESLMSDVSARERDERALALSESDLVLIRRALSKRFVARAMKPDSRSSLSNEDRENLKRYAVQNDLPVSRFLTAQTAQRLKSEGSHAALNMPVPTGSFSVRDPKILQEIRDRLYELNFDPGPEQGPSVRAAIREYQIANHLPDDGEPTEDLLRRLREAGQLRPWGAIVYAKGANWGMSWGHFTRKQAVADAHSSCRTAQCSAELSFSAEECGAFANSSTGWAIVARDGIEAAKKAALDECAKRGKVCQVIAAVCANGAGRFGATK
jgi:Domain of unknown function (DUF4189)